MNIQQKIDVHRNEIAEFCRQHGIHCLEVFGSCLSSGTPQDIDFLVDLGDIPAKDYAEIYFSLQEFLEDLFKLPVDLVTPPGLENPYFRQRVEQEKTLLYAA